MEAVMKSLLVRAAALAAVVFALSAAGHHFLRQQIFICDTATNGYVSGTVVTVSYDGGSSRLRPRGRTGSSCPPCQAS